MADYTAWSKAFSGAGKPKVAGYLPAPKPARFVSGAERAAEGLGETVKAESLKNALVRGGAKPAELEYAGLDDFIAGNAGKKVPKADVLTHLKEKGPLGQLQQVDQKHVGGGKPPSGNHLLDTWNEMQDEGFTDAQIDRLTGIKPPASIQKVADHPVGTFDEDGAFPKTVYHPYTEQGKTGDHSNYRETLIRDPANHPDGRTSGRFGGWAVGSRHAINAHDSDYWIRYHDNPDAIAVQNVQSDIGQDISKHGSHQLVGAENGEPMTFQQWSESLVKERDAKQAELDAGGDSTLGIEIAEINAEIERIAKSQKSVSPIAKGDNWKNLLARHVLLQAAESGKPITLPTGKNAYEVEGMPVNAATHFYEKDMVDRMSKIAKQYGDGAAGVNIAWHGQPSVEIDTGLTQFNGYSPAFVGDSVIPADEVAAIHMFTGESLADSALPNKVKQRLHELNGAIDWNWNSRPTAPTALTSEAERLQRAVRDGWGEMSPADQQQVMKVLNRVQLARERGDGAAQIVGRLRVEPDPNAPRPGTHIQLTPIARRNILDRGMDIMSIAAPITTGALYGLNSQDRPVSHDLRNRVSN
jgi:hypothetical protein